MGKTRACLNFEEESFKTRGRYCSIEIKALGLGLGGSPLSEDNRMGTLQAPSALRGEESSE